jgi:hypothetical protein
MGGLKKIPGQGGSGGKRGHSNMEHWAHTDEIKAAARTVRRAEAKQSVRDGIRDDGGATLATMDAAGLPAIIEAIRHLHGLEATWLESVPVVQTHEGQTVWAGEVQVLALEHPKASRVYAWSHETSAKKRRFHVVLGIPPVTGPQRAVRVAVLSEGAGLR